MYKYIMAEIGEPELIFQPNAENYSNFDLHKLMMTKEFYKHFSDNPADEGSDDEGSDDDESDHDSYLNKQKKDTKKKHFYALTTTQSFLLDMCHDFLKVLEKDMKELFFNSVIVCLYNLLVLDKKIFNKTTGFLSDSIAGKKILNKGMNRPTHNELEYSFMFRVLECLSIIHGVDKTEMEKKLKIIFGCRKIKGSPILWHDVINNKEIRSNLGIGGIGEDTRLDMDIDLKKIIMLVDATGISIKQVKRIFRNEINGAMTISKLLDPSPSFTNYPCSPDDIPICFIENLKDSTGNFQFKEEASEEASSSKASSSKASKITYLISEKKTF